MRPRSAADTRAVHEPTPKDRAHRRARLDAWLLRGSCAPSPRFWSEAARRNASSLRGILAILALVLVAWWPTDALVFEARPELQAAYASLRLSYLAICAVTFVALRTALGVRHHVALFTLSTWAFSYATIRSLGPSLIEEGWFYAAYVVPFATAPLFMPLRARLMAIAAMVGVWFALLLSTVGKDMPTSVAAPYAAYASFTSLAAVGIGHFVCYHAADAFRLREQLAELNQELEDRVLAQTRDLRALARQAVSEREIESRRVASELHDDVGQLLAGLRIELGLIERIARGDAAAESVGRLSTLLDDLGAAIRATLLRLRPRILDDLGPLEAIRWLAEEAGGDDGPKVEVRSRLERLEVPDDVALAMFRVAQESLTNIRRHARAERAVVSIERVGGTLRMTVADDGVGAASYDRAQGLGILGMRERAYAVGAALRVEPARPRGTAVIFEIEERST